MLLEAADLIGLSLHYSSKRDFQTHKSNQKGALGHWFLLAGEPARDDEGVKQGSSFFNLPLPFLQRGMGEARENA